MPAIDLLAKMQATRIHLALIIDEYGGSDGLVSIEDLVELIVGDIADEHDEAETPTVTRQSDGSFLATGRASLEDVRAVIGEEFDVGDAAQEVDTLGGYLVMRARTRAGARRTGAGSGRFRGRGAGRRSAPGEAGENLSPQGPPAGAAREPAECAAAVRGSGAGGARRCRPAQPERATHAVKPKDVVHAIVLAWGWRRWLIAFAAGALSARRWRRSTRGRFCS